MDEFYVKKAEKELREDECRKKQSLEQYREWITKHQFIRVRDMSVLSEFQLL